MENEIFDVVIALVNAIVPYIVEAVALIIIVVLSKKVFPFFREKVNSEIANKYIEMAEAVIVKVVKATNQTYVDSLKKNGAFDQNAWVTAFEKSKNNVLKLLSDAQKEVITELYGDVESWINVQIEATVNELKVNKELASATPASQVVNISQIPSEVVVEDAGESSVIVMD